MILGRMLHSRFTAEGFTVDVWEEATPGKARSSQDASLVLPLAGKLRLAAIDGVTPHPENEYVLGCDSAVYAAQTVRTALHRFGSVDRALEEANSQLHTPGVNVWRLPRAQAVVAELAGDSVWLWRAGDCEAFACYDGIWQPVFPLLVSEDERRAAIAFHGAVDLDTLMRSLDAEEPSPAEDSHLVETAPLGSYENVYEQRAMLSGWQELILASDGARLTPLRCTDLCAWLEGLRGWEQTAGDGLVEPWKPHDDVTVLRVRPA